MLKVALEAVAKAEKQVMKYFNEPKNPRFKGEIDIVTEADVLSEKTMLTFLREKFPDHGFILEEQDNILGTSEYQWIIDPIDGTTSFAHNYPMFSISIALYKKGIPLVGVVSVPYLKELFYAQSGKGAYLNNQRITVSRTSMLKESLIATGFPYTRLHDSDDNQKEFSRMMKHIQEIRRSGSSAIDICYVACGRLDGYWELGLKTIDTAGALVILTESGGIYSDFNGNPIKHDYSRIVASNGKIHDAMIKIIRGE